MRGLEAPAKINLALVVGPRRPDGKHELVTVYQRLDLADRLFLREGNGLRVDGFAGDSLVGDALRALAVCSGTEPRWHVRIEKRIPVAAGLGGGSSDAAAALRLANDTLERPLARDALHELAASLGADVPFFLAPGPQLGEGDGTELAPLELPQDYWVVLLMPEGEAKSSTSTIYEAFDARRGEHGYEERRAALLAALAAVRRPRDLADLPQNDLARSPFAGELERLGAFRAGVSGAGPAVYGLFEGRPAAIHAAEKLGARGRTWIVRPAWYG